MTPPGSSRSIVLGGLLAGCALLSLPSGPALAQPGDPADPPPAAPRPAAPVDAALAASFDASAPPTHTTTASLTLFYENDGTFLKPNHYTDRHYTSGQGFAVMWHDPAGDRLARALNLDADGTALGLTVVQQMFTPNNIDNPVPDPNDRPYAGYLYVGGFWQRHRGNVFDHVELDLGVVGPSSLAEPLQEWVHDVTDSPDPNWDGQLGDELAVNLAYRRKWRLDLGPAMSDAGTMPEDFRWQLIPEVGLDVGTVYRRAHVGATLRGGINLPDDFGPGRLTDAGSATGRPLRGFSAYGFAQAIGRYNEWNTFIEGSYSRNPSPSVSLVPFTAELSLGFAIEWRRGNWVFQTAYRQTLLTDEFKEQIPTNTIASVALRAIYEF